MGKIEINNKNRILFSLHTQYIVFYIKYHLYIVSICNPVM